MTKVIKEFKDATGQSVTPDPVDTGDAHKNRTADETNKKEPMPKITTKAEVVSYVLQNLMQGSRDDAMDVFERLKGKWASTTASGNEVNRKSILTKESVDGLFGENLSEEFKDNAFTLFEAAVSEKVAIRCEEIETEFDKKLEEGLAAAETHIQGKVEEFMNYVAEEFVKRNEVAIENKLKNEIAESFMAGIKSVFEQHYVDIPNDKIDVVDKLATETVELKAKIEEMISSEIALNASIKKLQVEKVLDTVSEGMTAVDKARLVNLTSGISFSSVEDFSKKVSVIKENTFNDKKNVLTEEQIDGGALDEVKKDKKPTNEIEALALLMSK